jgi:hypothetical protein
MLMMRMRMRIARVPPMSQNVGCTWQNRADWQIANQSSMGTGNVRFSF